MPDHDGAHGWVGVLLDPGSDPDWDVVAELLEDAWRARAPKRALAELERRRAAGA